VEAARRRRSRRGEVAARRKKQNPRRNRSGAIAPLLNIIALTVIRSFAAPQAY
jgi:hypothetical protein